MFAISWILIAVVFSAHLYEVCSDNGELRIKGGSDAQKGAYPWQIAIYGRHPVTHQELYGCGGSVVNQQWVLSAAHCFTYNDIKVYFVVAGEHDLKRVEGSEQKFDLLQIIKHEKYGSTNALNDVALLKIDGKFKFNEFVAPINLATTVQHNLFEGNVQLYCVTSGWGFLDYASTSPTILQALAMPLLPLDTCKTIFGSIEKLDRNVTEDLLCSGYVKGDKSPCHGDSGSPLACLVEGRWTLAGVVSWGVGCETPILYSRVTDFHDWIVNKVASN